jgi:hypothetical protein
MASQIQELRAAENLNDDTIAELKGSAGTLFFGGGDTVSVHFGYIKPYSSVTWTDVRRPFHIFACNGSASRSPEESPERDGQRDWL